MSAALAPSPPARTWVVAFDDSEPSQRALVYARTQLAALGGGRLVIAHVVPPGAGRPQPSSSSHDPELARIHAGPLVEQLTAEATRVVTAGVVIVPRVYAGYAADLIRDVAEAEHAEKIVCGSHGLRGLEHFVVGSVAEHIVRRARCTVTVVRGEQ